MTDSNEFAALILAAGEGTRMKSDLAKVLHRLGGKPMIRHVVESVRKAGPSRIVAVVGHQADSVMDEFEQEDVEFVLQKERLGTGHAVMQARELLGDFPGSVMILNGDTPLLDYETLRAFLSFHSSSGFEATVMSTKMEDASGYGRIVKGDGESLERIVEERDAEEWEKEISEVNSGIFCVESSILFKALEKVGRNNSQKEYYLTDIVEILGGEGRKTGVFLCEKSEKVMGINTPSQLREAERLMLDG